MLAWWTFSILEKLKRPTLRQRRMLRLTRRLMAACCTAIAAFATLQCVTASIVTQPVVVAAQAHPTRRAYRRGGRGDPADARIGWLGYGARCGESGGGRHRADGHRRRAAAVRRHSFSGRAGGTRSDGDRCTGHRHGGRRRRPVMSWIWYPAPLATLRLVRLHRVTNPQAGRSCVLARSATAMDAAHDDAMTGGTLHHVRFDSRRSHMNHQRTGTRSDYGRHCAIACGCSAAAATSSLAVRATAPAGGGCREATGVVAALNVCR